MFLEKRDCDKCERAILIMPIILYVPSLTVAAHTREVLKSFASNLAQLPPCLCSYLPHPSPLCQNLTTLIVLPSFHHHHLPPHHLQLLPSYFLETNKKVTSKMTNPFRRGPKVRFVATATIGGRVKFVTAVQIFMEINAMSRIICVELQD